jgi:iron complex transport system substrate-binding protein
MDLVPPRHLMRRLVGSALAAVVVLTALAVPCQASVTARDDLGSPITLSQPARRIVAMAPNGVELLFAIGAGKLVVGVPSQTDYPPEARRLPKVGGFMTPDEEAILIKRPDLIVLAHGNPRPFIDRLRSRKIPVFVLHPQKVADIPRALRSLGKLTGRGKTAETVAAAFEKGVGDVHRRVRNRPAARTALLVWDDPLTLAGAGAYLNDALRLAGAKNIAADLPKPYPTMDPEQFTIRNPEVILFAVHGAGRVKDAAQRPGVRSTAAVKSGRVYHLDDNLLLRPGPRLLQGLKAMAQALHPEAFSKR